MSKDEQLAVEAPQAWDIALHDFRIGVSGKAQLAYGLTRPMGITPETLAGGSGTVRVILPQTYSPHFRVNIVAPGEADTAEEFLIPPGEQTERNGIFLGYIKPEFAGMIINAGVTKHSPIDTQAAVFGEGLSEPENQLLRHMLGNPGGFREVFHQHVRRRLPAQVTSVLAAHRNRFQYKLYPPGNGENRRQQSDLQVMQRREAKRVNHINQVAGVILKGA